MNESRRGKTRRRKALELKSRRRKEDDKVNKRKNMNGQEKEKEGGRSSRINEEE